MKQVIIWQYGNFIVTSHGNGLAYEFKNTAQSRHVFLQGDDAINFRADWQGYERAFPDRDIDVILQDLWDDYASVSEES